MVNAYIKKRKIGEGTYATIYLSEQYTTNNDCTPKIIKDPSGIYKQLVAIKKIKKNSRVCGIDINAVREIKALMLVKSPYIVELVDVFQYNGCINIVLEYIPHTLEDMLKRKDLVIMPADIKAWLIMILKGLHEIHSRFLIHRDIKPNNILFARDGVLKLADFGLCRSVSSERMTTQVITRWYRPPELLLGCRNYAFPADMWSVGCVMAEMFLRVPLFAADSDIKQLDLIFRALGTPDDAYFQNLCGEMPIMFKKHPRSDFESLFSAAGQDALDLMKQLLDLNPNCRPSTLKAVGHRYFHSHPYPTAINSLPASVFEEDKRQAVNVA
ncbi:UNVERIFIED_CONTAM: hypothetical protein PYX00_011378 [Menopon gallinae]|uniref:[RNA-polymerase]-subunit kinase n=1 Tax=Menopon gallinae TaxID=328185 RepID=A0AAW2H788_9NEOP